MEPSQFINQTRLSKKQQLQLHAQQHQQQSQSNKFFHDSPHDNNYHQQQPQQPARCQYFPPAAITSPPVPHFPGPPQHYVPQPTTQQLMSPTHHRRPQSVKKFHHQPDLNSIEVCIEYENQHSSGVGSKAPSSSSSSSVRLLYKAAFLLFFSSSLFTLQVSHGLSLLLIMKLMNIE